MIKRNIHGYKQPVGKNISKENNALVDNVFNKYISLKKQVKSLVVGLESYYKGVS